MVARMREKKCDAVNMDTVSIYAVAPVCDRDAGREIGFMCTWGRSPVSMETETEDWESDLADAVGGGKARTRTTRWSQLRG